MRLTVLRDKGFGRQVWFDWGGLSVTVTTRRGAWHVSVVWQGRR